MVVQGEILALQIGSTLIATVQFHLSETKTGMFFQPDARNFFR